VEVISRGLTLGLDLQGGTELEYEIEKPDEGGGQRFSSQEIAEIIRRRIDAYGLKEPRVQPAGEDRLLIEIPGVDASDVARVRSIINRTGRLEFRLVADPQQQKQLFEAAQDLGRAPDGYHWYTLIEEDPETGKKKREDERLLISDEALLDGKAIASATSNPGGKGGTEIAVQIQFLDADAFWRVTQPNVNRRLAIVIDDVRNAKGELVAEPVVEDGVKKIKPRGKVVSAPVIREPIMGNAEITGGFSKREADELVMVLRSGSLDAPLKLVKEQYVGPYQGAQSIRDGRNAIIIGLVLVVGFILVYYRTAGAVANIALVLNLLILLAALALRSATLTLPGIAGIMLTIGMSIDANVLIFERIREELKKLSDKPLLKSMRDGHSKALTTIIDANLTTLITALILHEFGTGPVRGFAITLSYGIVISMFTAIVVTRILFEALIRANWLKKLSMAEFLRDPDIPFIKRQRVAMVASLILVVAGLGLFFAKPGERLGIEFSAGTRVDVNVRRDVTADQIRSRLSGAGYEDAEVKRVGATIEAATGPADVDVSTFAIRLPRLVPQADIQSSNRIPPNPATGERGGAQVVCTLSRKLDPDRMAERLNERGSPESKVTVQDLGEGEYKYIVRNSDVSNNGDENLKDHVREIFGTQLIIGDIEQALGTDGESLLVAPGIRTLAAKEGEPLKVELRLDKAITPDDLSGHLVRQMDDVQVAAVGELRADGTGRSFSVTTSSGDLPTIKDSLKLAGLSVVEPFARIERISASVAAELGVKAGVALTLALFAIVAYIWFRFEFRFGIAAVAALVHDVAIALGALALFGFEINLTVIAALLTIIGYSLNDTIVVFDRIRENRREIRKTEFPDIVNISINQTLGRTLLTSLTTFLAVATLFAIGGAAIKDFAFTLMVGVVVGTYSSIFIASPILLLIGEQGAIRGPLSRPSARTVRVST
jgi:SecD/SecF fusion protein